eukprot:TRINITY_DN64466_c0_g1_i1.p1 TRINITY_DN64466_c0_g1~~TRINITY_DN64466_c0_g1_i1.p1  ORF type:complete len:210 (-),score=25.07 TRINITY_DN64466_c0_g1_i1:329-958(-)
MRNQREVNIERNNQDRVRKARFGNLGGRPWWNRLCTRCDAIFESDRLMEKHYRTCEVVSCRECGKKCPSETALNLHLKYVHKRLACPECFQVFQRNDDLMEHMRANHNTAEKVVTLTRGDCSWTASTMTGEELFQASSEGLVSIGDLRKCVAEAWGTTLEELCFVAHDSVAKDTLELAGEDFLIVKRVMLVEPTMKKHALDEKRRGSLP